jgi:hypothetical protein
MRDREALRVGGIAALLGGVGAIVVNALHPRPPERTDELLTLVASMPHWTIIHYGAVWATALIVSGVALLVPTLQDARARALGQVGKYTAALGAAVFLVAIMIDGHGYPVFAGRWMAASGDERSVILWAASAVHTVDAALFPVWSGLFLGLGILLVAVALWRSAEYPRLFTALGMAGGVMCVIYALSTVGGFTVPLPLWPLGPAIDGIWLTLLGVMMVRRSSSAGDRGCGAGEAGLRAGAPGDAR